MVALGDVAFAYAGHSVVLEIQATIPSTPEKPSKGPMWKGVIVAYIVVALCYFPVAFIGYWMFGNEVEDNILISLGKPVWLIAAANMFVVIHVIGSYQIFAMPVFDMMETVLIKRLHFEPSIRLRFTTRTVFVCLTMFLGMTFPFFSGLLAFFGGLVFAPTTFFLPCIMWLKIFNPRKFSLSWWSNWVCYMSLSSHSQLDQIQYLLVFSSADGHFAYVNNNQACIVLGVTLMIVAPIGGLRSIILHAKSYKFYS
ncbi:hypothetical protein QQ045_007518 [Rhodiola kirilowii]